MSQEEVVNRNLSLQRAEELRESISDYLSVEPFIETGFRVQDRILENRQKILEYFDATQENWDDWVWQMKHRITDVEPLQFLLNLPEKEVEELKQISKRFRWCISPYYLSLIDFEN